MPLVIKITAPCDPSTVEAHVSFPLQQIQEDTPDSIMRFVETVVNDTFNQTATTAHLLASTTTPSNASVASAKNAADAHTASAVNAATISGKGDSIKIKIVPPGDHTAFSMAMKRTAKVSDVRALLDIPGPLFVFHEWRRLNAESTLEENGIKDDDTLLVAWLADQSKSSGYGMAGLT